MIDWEELRVWTRRLRQAGVGGDDSGFHKRIRVYLHRPRRSNPHTYEDVLKRRRIRGFKRDRGHVVVSAAPGETLPMPTDRVVANRPAWCHPCPHRFGTHGNRLSFATMDEFRDWAVWALDQRDTLSSDKGGGPTPAYATGAAVPDPERTVPRDDAPRAGEGPAPFAEGSP